MAAVGNVTYANPTAYQGSGLEKSTSAANTQKDNQGAVEAPEAALAVSEKKRAGNSQEGTPMEIRENANTNESIKRAVEQINRKAKNSEAIFGIHDATNRVTIKIVDKTTREVIKEFPPEETLDMIAKAWELAGLMVDEKR